MRYLKLLFLALLVALPAGARESSLKLPYAKAGLSQHQAAAYLLNRLTFGARPGEVDRVCGQGLENWLEQQLTGALPDQALKSRLEPLSAVNLSCAQIAQTYVPPGRLKGLAQKMGVDIPTPKEGDEDGKKQVRQALTEFARSQGIRPLQELISQLVAQKLLRAVYTDNQLREVMTDFWFNHFNVSLTNRPSVPYILSYERDVIRPNALGKFGDLLFGTAKHPAMLTYLNNAQSVAAVNATTTFQTRRPTNRKKKQAGLNENYARELMELHTLGVDGGYTQKDVTEVARALTGWTLYPEGPQAEKQRAAIERGQAVGFVHQGEFLFRADAHDAGSKLILGHEFPAGRGLDEGEQVLNLLLTHPSTARFISTEFAARFVSDTPPPSLVKKLTATYLSSKGDIQAMTRTLVQSPEFWSAEARRAKVKSPLELMASSLRALDADFNPTRQTYQWLERMGQPIYSYRAPTGFPDKAQAWINSGTLLNRMNFGLVLASGKLSGAKVDLSPLAPTNQKPEDQLKTVAQALLPGRDLKATLNDLTPLVKDPTYAQKLSARAEQAATPSDDAQMDSRIRVKNKKNKQPDPVPDLSSSSQLAQVVGILLGSPEFQRR